MPTVTTYRRALSERLGDYGLYGTSNTGNVGGTTLICAAAFKASSLPSSYLAHAWIFVPVLNQPRQRRVTSSGLDVSTGTITVDGAFAGQIQNGYTFEVHRSMAPVDDGSKGPGLSKHGAINLALGHLVEPRIISLTTVAGQQDYDVGTAYPWFDRPERLVRVEEPPIVAGFAPTETWRDVEFIGDGETASLRFSVPYDVSGQTISVRCLTPADSWIRALGVWQEDADGLAESESQEAKPDVDSVVTAALVFCYEALSNRPEPDGSMYRDLYEKQLSMARGLKYWDRTRDNLLPAPPQPPPAAAPAIGRAA